MEIEKAKKILGYSSKWLDFGIITEDELLNQFKKFNDTKDDNPEYYHSAAFSAYLESKDSLTDQEIENIFKLKEKDSEVFGLHTCRIIELIYSNLLSDAQLQNIARYEDVQTDPINKCYLRTIIKRKINQQGLTNDIFEEIKNSKDFTIHEYILDLPDISMEQILWLAENGANKRIKNTASKLANKIDKS